MDGLRVQEVRRTVSRPASNGCIEARRSCRERLACDLYRLRGDRVLRAWSPHGTDHNFKVTHGHRRLTEMRRITPSFMVFA